MTLTRDVVKDLLSVYLAGEASADTRQLVEEYLRSDPELARDVEAVRVGHRGLPAAPALAPSAEKQALDATRQWLRTRTATLVIAVLFTLLPFSFVFEGSRITFVLFRDAPLIALAWWATAAVMWAVHISIRRRLRVSGL